MQQALSHLAASDPVLARLIADIGPYGIEFLPPDFSTLAKAIIYQQLSGKVAEIIFNRLAAAAANGGCLTPEAVLRLRAPRLRAIGLSKQKIEYIRELARRIRDGRLDLAGLEQRPDDEVYACLTALKGIGAWTVQMFLIFALRRPNVLPAADLGIRAAVRKAYDLPETPTAAQVAELARNWHPYCTVASWYLWRSLETKAGL